MNLQFIINRLILVVLLHFQDTGRTVGVYKYDCEKFVWNFIGKHRAHYKDVTAVFFLPQKNEDGEYKLLSLGADRTMVKFVVFIEMFLEPIEINVL